jgi:hypothetical protein
VFLDQGPHPGRGAQPARPASGKRSERGQGHDVPLRRAGIANVSHLRGYVQTALICAERRCFRIAEAAL